MVAKIEIHDKKTVSLVDPKTGDRLVPETKGGFGRSDQYRLKDGQSARLKFGDFGYIDITTGRAATNLNSMWYMSFLGRYVNELQVLADYGTDVNGNNLHNGVDFTKVRRCASIVHLDRSRKW